MPKGTAFVLVGHKNWGKSRSLKALADGSSQNARSDFDNNLFNL